MIELNVENKQKNLLSITANKLSYLAFLNLTTKYNLCSSSYEPLQFFFPQEDPLYNEIIKKLKAGFDKTQQQNLLPFGRLVNAEFIIQQDNLKIMLNQLATEPLNELQLLANALSEKTGFQINSQPEQQKIKTVSNNNANQIRLLDIDPSIENKIVFYSLYQENNNPLEATTDKIDLMTMEQKDQLWEKLFSRQPTKYLPQIITEHNFCSLEITAPFAQLEPLALAADINLLMQPPTTELGFSLSDEIIRQGWQETYLLCLEPIKRYFTETKDSYSIPFLFNQRALISINLNALTALIKLDSPLKKEIFEEIAKHLPFLNILIK